MTIEFAHAVCSDMLGALADMNPDKYGEDAIDAHLAYNLDQLKIVHRYENQDIQRR